MTDPVALDTSVAIPLLVQSHRDHSAVTRWWDGRDLMLSGHALVETYSVLTRLPGDNRLAPADAARLLVARFGPPLLLKPATSRQLPQILGRLGISGGAVYDAMVGLAATEHDAVLATRDARAKLTYDAIGVQVEIAA